MLAAANRAESVQIVKRSPSARGLPAAPRHDVHHTLLSMTTKGTKKIRAQGYNFGERTEPLIFGVRGDVGGIKEGGGRERGLGDSGPARSIRR